MSNLERFSPAAWIGEVPSHWKRLEPRRLFRLRREPERPSDVHLTPSQRFGVLPQKDYVQRTGQQVVRNLSNTAMQHVEPGDFISHLRTFQGGLELSRNTGKVSPAYTVVTPRNGTDLEFYKFTLKSVGYISQIASITDQLRDGQSMRFPEFNQTWLPAPPPDEQRAIADYLDHETAEIDAFLADTDQMRRIEQERSEAQLATWLTHGLDNSPARTPAHGIGWLDGAEIPEHWNRVKLGILANLQSGLSISGDRIHDTGSYPVYGGGGLRGYTSKATHPDSHLMVGRQGALCGKVFHAEGPFYATEHAVVVTPKFQVDQNWLSAILRFMNLGQYSTSAAQPGLSVDDISKIRLPLPPISEQVRLGKRIAEYELAVDEMSSTLELAASLARERRAALISAAVTGQIDVTQKHRPVAEQLEDEVKQLS